MTNHSRIKFIVAVLLITVLAISLFLRRKTVNPGWGKGNFSAAEASYYSSRINRLIENWLRTGNNAIHDSNGFFVDSYRAYLIIDFQKQCMWIEENGQVQKNSNMELPTGNTWKLYHLMSSGIKELPQKTILKIRGRYTKQQTPEAFYLVGTFRDKGFISLQIDGQGCSNDYSQTKFVLPNLNFKSQENNDFYGTLLVREEEYQEYRDTIPDFVESQAETNNIESEHPSKLAENEATWNKIEKYLYQEIEKRVQAEGYKLNNISIIPEQDFSEANGDIRAYNGNIIQKILGRSYPINTWLKIDNFGNDIWYVKSGPDPRFREITRPNIGKQIDFEFLISTDGKIDKVR